MPLSRLENFLINTDGNILYVNPSDLDATDSFDNKGNSLTRPFKTIQRALLEAARFAYQSGPQNDRFDRTTILLYPGTHLIDNRPGLSIKQNGNVAQYFDINEAVVGSPDIELTNNSVFDLNNQNNVLYKFNSVTGGVIVPKGTSVIGYDLRKTKIKPLYVPDPQDDTVPRSAIFNVTGGCYFWQFSLFDGDRPVYYNKNFNQKTSPVFSHHKLTCFEYADGVNVKTLTGLTDLQQYYYKLMNAYGDDTGVREIVNFPQGTDFEPNSPEFKIVGDLVSDDNPILELSSVGKVATVLTEKPHNFTVDDSIRILGISSETYNGGFKVVGVTSERKFTYNLLSDPAQNNINPTADSKVAVEVDNVTGASPYIFNISLRSTFGMCGMHADGDKATGFKSMVVAQFTGIGLQKDDNAFVIYNDTTGSYDTEETTVTSNRPLHLNQEAIYKTGYTNFHIKSSNNAVIQAVSVFAIGFAEHFVTEDGGDQSITNSNSNFGAKSLISKGFRKQSFDRDDTGYITHVVPPKDLQEEESNVLWKTLDVGITTAVGITSHLYLLGETDESNPPTNITNGFRVGSRDNEVLYLEANIDGTNVTYSAPVVMQVPAGKTPVSTKKEFLVTTIRTSGDTPKNELDLNDNHNFTTGESVRVYSDDGVLPDGIVYGQTYYVINVDANTIKLAKSLNNALADSSVDIKNNKGGVLRICSRVTDKLPGDFGHPVQYDSTLINGSPRGWYILTDHNSNGIYTGLAANPNEIAANNSSTYVKRKSERRDLSDRIYRFRYVIPKEMLNAKAPSKNFIIQESKNVIEESTIAKVTSNRNPRVIALATYSGNQTTITSELEHRLIVGDRVRIKNIQSSANTTAADNAGYNGYFTVIDTPTPTTFKYISSDGGTFQNAISARNTSLPTFERNEYNSTYTIEAVETIQEYISDLQDGIYYLTVILGNVSPTVAEFSNQKFKQSAYYLYPTVDKDNLIVDPLQSISAASNKLIGEVLVDDSQNSITKEGVVSFLRDNRIGFGVTGATCDNNGVVSLNLSHRHNINGVASLSVNSAGSGYSGVATVLHNVVLTNTTGQNGEGVTANVTINGSGAITSAEVVHAGCGYTDSVGSNFLVEVPGGSNGKLSVTINQATANEQKAVQVVGVGTPDNRNASGYNGTYLLTEVVGPKEIKYVRVGALSHGSLNTSISTGSNVGIFTDSPNALVFISGNAAKLDLSTAIVGSNPNAAGIATVNTVGAHGFQIGNSIKLDNVTGSAATVYSGKDFIVQRVPTANSFEIKTEYGVSSGATLARALRNTLSAYGEDTSLTSEKIGGRLITLTGRDTDTFISSAINETAIIVPVDNVVGLRKGDFIQIDDEVMRIKTVDSTTQITVYRGALGTTSKGHIDNSLVRPIAVIPSEVRRFSSIRASGHTFEYVGYGPGNYSTALPQKQRRVIEENEEFLAISKEEKGGVTFFSGMNDRGEFFTWDGRIKSRETFLGEIGSDATSTFDDLYVRNTLRVGGGANRNLPSEFRGPVSFTNKVTSTANAGIDAIKLMLKGTSLVNPSFQVGPDANPSLIVNQSSQFVGIKTATPRHELDVNGTIRANIYENFKLTDLPNSLTEEATFGRNKILKVNDAGDGYELVDIHEINSFALRSYGISNDGTIYTGIATTKSTADAITGAIGSGSTLTSAQLTTKLGVNGAIKITGISTARFFVGQTVKVFGASEASNAAQVPGPEFNSMTVTKTGGGTGVNKYFYFVAQYHFRDGRVGISSQIGASTGVSAPAVGNFNDVDHVTLSLARTNNQHGLLVYRQIAANNATSANIDQAKLVGILGPKELGNITSNILYKDYGTYDQTNWSPNGTVNEYLGIGDTTTPQIHFPNIASAGQRRGWGLGEIIQIEANSITLDNDLVLFNDSAAGYGTTSRVNLTHDNTYALSEAISDTVASGGNYLDLPSGTYLTNKVVIPTGFTIKGNGKNTKLMQQYFATDADSGHGDDPGFDGNLIGSSAATPTDITIQDLVVDGNFANNIRFESESETYTVYLNQLNSSTLKNFEIRNSPSNALWIKDSNRVAMEGCTIVDGGTTDRYPYQPINAQSSTVLRMNDSLFENFGGAVDISVTSVVATGGNIIRNCGTGLRTFASGKITTKNNIILGPSDEFIPSPDIFDSDFNSVNLTLSKSDDLLTPSYLYIRNGDPYNLSDVEIISAGIGTIINEGQNDEALGTRFINFGDPITPLNGTNSRSEGYIQFRVPQSVIVANDANLGIGSGYGYNIIGEEYLENPVGLTTTVGISSGVWYKNGSPHVGTGVTTYLVTLKDANQFSTITEGDVVKLKNHSVSPSLDSITLIVDGKEPVNAATKNLRLKLLSQATINTGGQTALGGLETGYITIRDRFTIAKGRVGVTN